MPCQQLHTKIPEDTWGTTKSESRSTNLDGPAREIEERFRAAFAACGQPLDPDTAIPDDTPLLGSGLDSLGFATLVVQLEADLAYDPFTLMDAIGSNSAPKIRSCFIPLPRA